MHLALAAGAPVRADRLLDDLWAGTPTNRNTLQQKVARLRRSLGDPSVVAGGDDGYRLAVEPAAVDAHRVLRDVDSATALFDDGDYAAAAETSAAALALFREDVLPSAGDWAAPQRARLEEARMQLLETRFAARLRLGEDVIGELDAAVATAPYREGLWELLITALYRAGRQADALAAYQRVRTRLADELGLEPGPRLKEIEQQILTQDQVARRARGKPAVACSRARGARRRDRGTARPAGASPPRRGRRPRRHRQDGRSRSRRAARWSTVPVWLVRLEAAQTADDVLDTVVAALGVVGGEAALQERLRRTEAVLILDNCEHVVDAAAALAERLLDAAPALRVLVHQPGPARARRGGRARARAAARSKTRSSCSPGASARPGDPDEVRELCRSLDGLPLAIELAAARTRTLSVEEIARRLDDRFTVLSDPASRKPERRRALRATIGWSYDLLFPDDQRGLWALATFPGGAPLAAVESVLGALDVPAAAAIDVVGRLASRSLVIVDEPPRYRLLDSIRAFALEALAEAGLTERGFDAHAAWYADAGRRRRRRACAARSRPSTSRSRAPSAPTSTPRWPGARRTTRCARSSIANGFGWAWIVLGDSPRRTAPARRARRPQATRAPARERATALLLAAWIEASSGHLEPARLHIAAATELAVGDPDLRGPLRLLPRLRRVAQRRVGAGAGAHRPSAAAVRRARPPLGPGGERALRRPRRDLGRRPRPRRARHATRSSAGSRSSTTRGSTSAATRMLGELARVERRFDDAVTHLGRAAETSRRLGFLQTEAYQLTSLGRAQCQAGDYESGAATLELGIAKAEATGDVRLAALGRVHLGRILRALERSTEARAALEAAAAFHRAAGGGEQQVLGDTPPRRARSRRASERWRRSSNERARDGDAPAEVFALDALARLTGDDDLYAAADARMETASHFITERDRVDRRAD